MMRQIKSPFIVVRTGVTPLPRTRNNLPLCVPSATLIFTLPSKVGISTSLPKAASVMLTGTSMYKSAP